MQDALACRTKFIERGLLPAVDIESYLIEQSLESGKKKPDTRVYVKRLFELDGSLLRESSETSWGLIK